MLGGGMGYFSSSQGWSVDNIVGWQVVLASGKTIEVTTDKHDRYSDLAWALKGGSNFFGIVTRYDLRTFAITSAYGGVTMWNASARSSFFEAINTYVAPGGGIEDPLAHIDAFAGISFTDGVPSYTYTNIALYAGYNANPRAMENFTAIPSSKIMTDSTDLQNNWTSIPAQLDSFSTTANRNLFYAHSFKADPRSISIFNTTVMENAKRELSKVEGLTSYAVFQPISPSYLSISKSKGGNVLGLENEKGSFICRSLLSPFSLTRNMERLLINHYL